MNKEENKNLEKSEELNQNNDNNSINIENNKKELINDLYPKINDIISSKENIINNKSEKEENININESELVQQIKTEEYNYKEKKIKLYNFYKTLLNFRQKLIIKEKQLNQRELNLLEFEKILKSNEAILKHNIEQFDSYIRAKIFEIKKQFNQIELLQMNKEQYLKKKEEEIKNETYNIKFQPNQSLNIKKCINCNKEFFSSDELNNNINNDFDEQINKNYCDICMNYLKNMNHQKTKSTILQKNNLFDINDEFPFKSRKNNNLSNHFNCTCFCPTCNFCNL